MESKLQVVFDGILKGDMNAVTDGVKAALEDGVEANVILQEGLIPAMNEVGRLYEQGEYFVPEMLVAARAMQNGLQVLRPQLIEDDVASAGTVVIATVQGDLHDIGKNLVGMMLEGAGFDVVDLGVDVTPEDFVAAVKEHSPSILAMSALLTTTMPHMKKTLTALEEAGLRDSVKVIIGGAPITGDYAKEIGADGFAPDASRATKLAKSFA